MFVTIPNASKRLLVRDQNVVLLGPLERCHAVRLRVHERQDARLQPLGKALEPIEPHIGGRPRNLEEPGQIDAAVARPNV
jgi:hypothetical protein